jgi:hypothetical protein
MEELTDMEKLRFYREEVKHEFNLLAMRSTILVTCQSFLVVPFAILNTMADYRDAVEPIVLIAMLGLFVALVMLQPLRAGHRALDKWLVKQRDLLQSNPALRPVALDRDLQPGVRADARRDRDHVRSLMFTRTSPWAFVLFWIAAIAWAFLRL